MANRYRNLIYSTAEYTHSYGDFKGIELNGGSLINSRARLAYAQNMYKDYDGDGADVIESIPGFRCFAHYGKTIHALYCQRASAGNEDHLIVHVGDKLMRHPVSDIYKKDCLGEEIATLENGKSFGFEYGKFFYVMDTKSIFRIDESGECVKVGEMGAELYVPTTYVSGEAYEQRNLLSDKFKEEFYIADPCAYLHSSEGLKITVTDPYLRYCSVSGVDETVVGEVYLPAYVNIANESYKVASVGEYAFADNPRITAVYVASGISSIERCAFSGCRNLKTVVTPSSLISIGERAFYDCTALNEFYLGAGVNTIGDSAFLHDNALTHINYALTHYELTRIEGYGNLQANSYTYNSSYGTVKISLPMHDDVLSITDVSVDGVTRDATLEKKDGKIKSVTVDFPSLSDTTGVKVIVSGELTPLDDGWSADMTAYDHVTPYEAVLRCTTAEVFDGRIFFSGNPSLPNTVFYTERTKVTEGGALYVGRYNYFNDGVGGYKVKSMLAVRDMLAVFKEGDDGSGSIFYHKREFTNYDMVDTLYPVAYVHSGISSVGGCISFLDDPVFLSAEGLMGLNSENINYQRNVTCRSHNVNFALLKEDLSRASLCEWLGYLVLGVDGKIFLADSRAIFSHPTGSREYEWFMLTDIVTYEDDLKVYRYAQDPFADAIVHPSKVGEAVDYWSVQSEDFGSELYHYVTERTTKYRVIPTNEKYGGTFHPGGVFISHKDLLFFATDNGDVCVFNNDMRGIAPESVRSAPDFDEEEYAKYMSNKIHPEYYSFNSHAPTYVVRTALDNCGVPHLTKNTVKNSLVIKAKSYTSDAIACEVITDGNDPVSVGSFPAASVGFDDFSFISAPWYVSRYTSVTLPEHEKRWIEKQIALSASSFESPISIYSITYRYTIKGRIKNST